MRFESAFKGLRLFLGLNLPDKFELLRLWALLNLVHLRLLLIPHRWNRFWLQGPAFSHTSAWKGASSRTARIVKLLTWAAGASSRDATCLRRSLTLRDRLLGLGLPAVLVFGIRRDQGSGVMAHAWVEVCGQVLDTYGTAEHFIPLKAQTLRGKEGPPA
jgi:hypothetical protein